MIYGGMTTPRVFLESRKWRSGSLYREMYPRCARCTALLATIESRTTKFNLSLFREAPIAIAIALRAFFAGGANFSQIIDPISDVALREFAFTG